MPDAGHWSAQARAASTAWRAVHLAQAVALRTGRPSSCAGRAGNACGGGREVPPGGPTWARNAERRPSLGRALGHGGGDRREAVTM